jgi:hypothetical protein
VQVLLAQQGCVAPPQAMQVPPPEGELQMVSESLQMFSAQHGSPGLPQWTQMLFTQIVARPSRLQRWTGQQTCPSPPQT